jgi:hypothetical protein
MSKIFADPIINILDENDGLNPRECKTLDNFIINSTISKLTTTRHRELIKEATDKKREPIKRMTAPFITIPKA